MFSRTLCGMVESGAWICFDHAQRLTASTLAMLSQHIKHILEMYHVVSSSNDTQYIVRDHDGYRKLKVLVLFY